MKDEEGMIGIERAFFVVSFKSVPNFETMICSVAAKGAGISPQ